MDMNMAIVTAFITDAKTANEGLTTNFAPKTTKTASGATISTWATKATTRTVIAKATKRAMEMLTTLAPGGSVISTGVATMIAIVIAVRMMMCMKVAVVG